MRNHLSDSFIPRLESLENRWCPSCTVSVNGGVMRIIGDSGANAVTVTHDGAGNVTATCDSAAGSGSNIKKIIIDTKGGDDTVNLSVTGNLTTRLDLDLNLGAGNDTANLKFAAISTRLKLRADLGAGNDVLGVNLDQEIRPGAKVDLDVKGSDGADTWNLSANEVRSGAELKASFDGGRHNDTLNVFLGDPIDSGAEVTIIGRGGDGNDSLKVDATTFGTGANIAAGAELKVSLDGGNGADTLDVSYDGDVDGKFDVGLAGGPGNDTVTANVTVNSGSTGEIRARVNGGSGNDNLTLNVFDLSAGMADIKARLDGGAGFDTCVTTPNVEKKNCEA